MEDVLDRITDAAMLRKFISQDLCTSLRLLADKSSVSREDVEQAIKDGCESAANSGWLEQGWDEKPREAAQLRLVVQHYTLICLVHPNDAAQVPWARPENITAERLVELHEKWLSTMASAH